MTSRRYLCGATAGVLATAAALTAALSAAAGRPAALAHSSMKLSNASNDADVPRQAVTATPWGRHEQPHLPRRRRRDRRRDRAEGLPRALGLAVERQRPVRRGVASSQSFFTDVGGSSWLNSVTQYCQGVASGTVFCNGAGTAAGTRGGIYARHVAATTQRRRRRTRPSRSWPPRPSRRRHTSATRLGLNSTTQYVIATAHGQQRFGLRDAILRVAQLDLVLLRQHRLHEPAVHHRRRRLVRGELQRPRAQGGHHDRRGPRDGRDDHRPVPERGLARPERRGERRQVRLDHLRPGRVCERVTLNGATLPRPVAVEQRFQQRQRRLRPLLSVVIARAPAVAVGAQPLAERAA